MNGESILSWWCTSSPFHPLLKFFLSVLQHLVMSVTPAGWQQPRCPDYFFRSILLIIAFTSTGADAAAALAFSSSSCCHRTTGSMPGLRFWAFCSSCAGLEWKQEQADVWVPSSVFVLTKRSERHRKLFHQSPFSDIHHILSGLKL